MGVLPIRAYPALALALVAVAGCKREPAPPPEAAAPVPVPASERPPQKNVEIEPNDFQRPLAVPERSIIEGTFEPERKRFPDDDWFRVAPGPGGELPEVRGGDDQQAFGRAVVPGL